MIRILAFAACLVFASAPCFAAETNSGAPAAPEISLPAEDAAPDDSPSLWSRFSRRVSQTWDSSTVDLYIPVRTWHNRLLYDSRASDYNEAPWGLGIGKSFIDEDGDWHSLFYVGFQDSNDMYQPVAGYGFQKNWPIGDNKDWRLGLGFTASLTARQEYDYIPLPLVLPLFGVEYKRAALQATYIPGTYNNGNVLFCWLRFQLN